MPATPQALRAARLFDGERPVANPVLVLDGTRLASVGEEPPAGVPTTDLGDATLLPGLVDAHVHLAFDATLEAVAHLRTTSDEDMLAGMREAARRCLRAGVTTVRDLGDRHYLALRIREETACDPFAGPQVLASGPPITVPDGHCWFLGGVAEGVDALRAAVADRADRGVDVIKVMASGGDMTPRTQSHVPQFTVEELRVVVGEAHRYGLPVTAHAHATTAIRNVVEAGVDSIEHCTFLTEDGVDADPALIQSLVDTGIPVSVALGVIPGEAQPPDVLERLLPRLAAIEEALRRLVASGAVIVCSSDGGIGPAKPHEVLPYAVADLVTMGGATPAAAIEAATAVPASVCGLADHKGRLAAGLDADILAVYGDPLADVARLRDVAAVYRLGERIR